MRLELLYNPRLLCERLAELSIDRRRLRKLSGTVADQLTTGHIESLELLELLRPLRPRVFCDIGGNVGTWTLLAKALYPDAEIHAFEPLEIHWTPYEAATRSLAGVTLHRVALGSGRGEVPMHVLDRSDSSSLLPMTAACTRHFGLQESHTIAVTVERLDDMLEAGIVTQPDVVKLDVQGYELEALRGAEKSLRGAQAILLEVSFVPLYAGQCLFHEVADFMAERGFYLFALSEGTALSRPLLQTDALFVADAARVRLGS